MNFLDLNDEKKLEDRELCLCSCGTNNKTPLLKNDPR